MKQCDSWREIPARFFDMEGEVMSDTSAVVTTPQPGFLLVPEFKPHGHPSATIPVRWFISEALRQEMTDKNITDACVAIVVVHNNREVSRVIRHLHEAMAYVQIPCVGESTVMGAILYRGYKTSSFADELRSPFDYSLVERIPDGSRELSAEIDHMRSKREEFVDRWQEESDVYEDPMYRAIIAKLEELDRQHAKIFSSGEMVAVFSFEPNYYNGLDEAWLGEASQFDVTVPKELFAKERPWLDAYSRIFPWWKEAKDRDECSRRNRVLWMTVLMPIWLPIFMLIWLGAKFSSIALIAVMLLFGMRDIDYRPLTVPGIVRPFDVWDSVSTSRWFTRLDTNDVESPQPLWRRIVNPPTLLALVLIGTAFMVTSSLVKTIVLSVVGGVTLLVGLVVLGRFLYRKRQEAVNSAEAIAIRRAERERDFDELVCRTIGEAGCDGASLKALPEEKRSYHLRFQDLKAKVCKPMARQ